MRVEVSICSTETAGIGCLVELMKGGRREGNKGARGGGKEGGKEGRTGGRADGRTGGRTGPVLTWAYTRCPYIA